MKLPWKVKFIDDKEILELNIGRFRYEVSCFLPYTLSNSYWKLYDFYMKSHIEFKSFEELESYIKDKLLFRTTKYSLLIKKAQKDINAINEMMNKVDRSWPYSLFKER